MKVRINTIHDRLGVIAIVKRINKCGLVEAKNRVDNSSSTTPLILDISQSYLTCLQKYCTFKIIENNMKNQFEFKMFDKVLVRDSDQGQWRTNFYSHLDDNGDHVCIMGIWNQCIPYNENTAHLVGTNEPYEEPEPKVWQIMSTGYNKLLTSEELTNFIQNAVINNKDVTDFRIRYLINN